MISIAEVKTKLKTDLVAGSKALRSVGGTADLLSALDQLKASNMAFVMPAAKRASVNMTGSVVVSQKVMEQISVIVGFTNAGPTGDAHTDDIETIDAALIGCLVGWQPTGAQGPFEYVGGKVVGFDANKQTIFWGADFRAPSYVRN